MGLQNDVSFMRSKVNKVNFNRLSPVMTYADHQIYVHACLEPGHFYVDHLNDRIVMGPLTWRTLNHDMSALHGLLTDMARGTGGMRFENVVASGHMQNAAKAEAVAVGADVIHAKDALTILTERCGRLINQAASMGRAPTEFQLKIFYRELADLQTEYTEVRARMGKLEAMLQLAGTTIATAA